jgi:transposase
MNYTAIDWHKKYSAVCTMDEAGRIIKEKRIAGNHPQEFEAYFRGLEEPTAVVHEACWNWGKLYDMLEEMEGVREITLAHPFKTRLIADAQIKTDKVDARALATLLRGNLVARVHLPSREARQRKNWLRQRLYWVRTRTMLRNRVHALLDRQRELSLPAVSDLFGVRGMKALKALKLSEPDQQMLDQDMETLELLQGHIKAIENELQASAGPAEALVRTIPGLGPILGAVVVAEIDTIERFASSDKLCAYAGLVPTTYASGGKAYHGHLLPHCNKWLRWALIEAAWSALSASAYFNGIYRSHRQRGKHPSVAITIVARRLCKILWSVLREQRAFNPFPGRSLQRMKALS